LKIDLATVVEKLEASPKGKALGEVLKILAPEIGNGAVTVSNDERRATVALASGNFVAVRVAPPGNGSLTRFRFKCPRDLGTYERLYFGGLAPDGRAVVQRFAPMDLSDLQTITVRGPAKS
jgi:hypothetical protein